MATGLFIGLIAIGESNGAEISGRTATVYSFVLGFCIAYDMTMMITAW